MDFPGKGPNIEEYGFFSAYCPIESRLVGRIYQHQEIQLNYLEKGAAVIWFGGRKYTVTAGHIHAFWPAIPSYLQWFEKGSALYFVTVPLPWFLQWQLDPSFTNAILRGEIRSMQESGKERHDRGLFERWHRYLQQKTPELRKIVLLEIEARFRRLTLENLEKARNRRSPLVSSKGGVGSQMMNDKTVQMVKVIAQKYAQPLSMDQVARSVGLNTKYAMTLFRKALGMTLLTYLTKHRLWHAQRKLATTDQKVLDIALESGFGSLSQFYEVFSRAVGGSPRQYRRRSSGKHRILP